MHGESNQTLIGNAFLHETANLDRNDFLRRTANVKALRVDPWPDNGHGRPFLTLVPKAVEQWIAIEKFHNLVKTGKFDYLNERFRRYVFSITISSKLYTWFKNTELDTVKLQILNWHAARGVIELAAKHRTKLDELQIQVRENVEEIIRSYYAPRIDVHNLLSGEGYSYLERINDLNRLYVDVSKQLSGCAPPTILRLFDREIKDEERYEWGIHSDFSFEFLIAYFSESDWENVIIHENDDDLIRSESKKEFWDIWLQIFTNYPERCVFVFDNSVEPRFGGFVYLIQEAANGWCKIGHTFNPEAEKRMASLQTGSPGKLTLLGVFPVSSPKTERIMQNHFASKRLRENTEWFNLADTDIRNALDEQWRLSNNIF